MLFNPEVFAKEEAKMRRNKLQCLVVVKQRAESGRPRPQRLGYEERLKMSCDRFVRGLLRPRTGALRFHNLIRALAAWDFFQATHVRPFCVACNAALQKQTFQNPQ